MHIIIFVCFITIFANCYGKYIDLLPDEEKQEFLDSVMRRILENVEVKVNKTISSGELSDNQLKQHDDFVNTILKQESEQIRKSKGGVVSKKEDEVKLDVQPLKTAKGKIDTSGTIHVDSTVNDKLRRSYDEMSKDNFTDNIKNDVDTSLLQKRSVQIDDKTKDIQNDKYVTNISKTDYKNHTNDSVKETKTPNVDTDIPSIGQAEVSLISTTEFEYSALEQLNASATEVYSNTTVDDSDNVNKNNTNEKDIIYIKTIKDKAIKDKKFSASFDSDHRKNKTSTDHPNSNGSDISQNKDASTLTPSFQISGSSDRSDNYQSRIKKLGTTLTNTYTSDEATIEYITKTSANDVATTYAPILSISKDEQKEDMKIGTNVDIDNDKTTVMIPALTPKTYKTTEKSNKKMTSNPKNSKLLSDLASKALQIVKAKHKSERIKLKKGNVYNSLINLQKKYKKNTIEKDKDCQRGFCKYYEVYEVDWPVSDDTGYISSFEPMENQLYFVPVYEYSSNRAFYDPQNRYGPNTIQENFIKLNTHPLRKGDKREKDGNVSEFILDLDDHRGEPDRQQEKITRTHSEECSASQEKDENTENFYFPNSNESLHPYNNMKNGLKTHIKAVRDILSHNKHFGNSNIGKKDYMKYLQIDAKDLHKNETLRSRIYDRNNIFNYFFNTNKKININQLLNQNKLFNVVSEEEDIYKRIRTESAEVTEPKEEPELKEESEPTEEPHFEEESQPEEKPENIKQKLNTISGITSVTDEKDVIINLNRLRDMNLNLMRSNNVNKVSVYLGALKYLIDEDSPALKQYDWLASTVQIRSALTKLKILINRLRDYKPVHPSDIQILKYMVFLHNLSSETRDASHVNNLLRSKLLAKNKKGSETILTEKGWMNRVWLYLNTHFPDVTSRVGISNLEDFILNVEDHLNNLHEALKNIAMITSCFKKQNWYVNLKELYLTTDDKQLGELLLHMSMARLIDLIENSCENGLENDFIKYMKTHRKEAKRTLDEIFFVVRILDKINKKMD